MKQDSPREWLRAHKPWMAYVFGRYRFCLLILVFFLVAGSIFALSGQPKEEFDQFIKDIREEKRVDRLGYLILVQLPVKKASEDKILSFAGKFFYVSPGGYLTHVNHVRMERMKRAKLNVKVIDKKRLDDSKEAWYMVWVENSEADNALAERFEPLYRHEQTIIIRIRPQDEDELMGMKLRYSLIEETLLPLKVSHQPSPRKKFKVEPFIQNLLLSVKKDALASTAQALEDVQSRYVKEPGNQAATEWLAAEFAKIPNLQVATPTFSSYSGNLSNVIAIQKGAKEADSVYVVCGHFDSTVSDDDRKTAPGADDNGTGIAGVLEIARTIGSMSFPCTILYACWNAEETGLVGSKAYAKIMAATTGLRIKAVFNMDMIADRDDNQVAVIGNSRSNWLIDLFKDVALAYTGLESKPFYNSNIWYSDHSSFWNIGASAILTIEGYPELSAHYHSKTDLVKNIEPSLMEKITRSNLAALLTLNSPNILKIVRE